MPKKVRRLALRSALSSKVQNDEIVVLEDLSIEAPKTKEVVQLLNSFDVNEKALIVTADKDENIERSANNLQGVHVLTVEQVNVLDLLKYDKLFMTKEAAEKAGEVLA